MIDIREHDTTPPAPGDVEIVQRFLNLHDHADGEDADQPPRPEKVRWYLVERGLLAPEAPYTEADHGNALKLYDAVHGRLRAQELGRPTSVHVRAIEEVAERAAFRIRFDGEPGLEPTASGVDGALGRLLAILFLAELDGGWAHMRECASDTCTAVFYDRSKNHSGKWCSMRSCGNRHKVRAWRERHRTDALDD